MSHQKTDANIVIYYNVVTFAAVKVKIMKKRFILSALVMALLTACTSTQDGSHNSDSQKNAIVAVHFGTSHSTTREKTIEAFNRLVEESFPNCDFFEAYTSEIIVKKLKKEGIEKFSPMELFQKLSNEGYTNIIVQSTNIIPGFEYQSLIDDAESVGDKFNSIEIGTPLLYDISDCETVASIIAERNPIKDKNHHIVFVGHGTQGPANALYSQIDYMLKSNHNSNYHVATIEGYPTLEALKEALKKGYAKQVTLVPFMFVAGDHAVNDIANDWKDELQEAGYKVELNIEGLGELPQIRELLLKHLQKIQ